MGSDYLHARLTVGKKGEILLPPEILHALGIKPGEEVIVRVQDGRVEIESVRSLEERLLSWFAGVPRDVSLVDELIAERREEARRDAAEMGIEL